MLLNVTNDWIILASLENDDFDFRIRFTPERCEIFVSALAAEMSFKILKPGWEHEFYCRMFTLINVNSTLVTKSNLFWLKNFILKALTHDLSFIRMSFLNLTVHDMTIVCNSIDNTTGDYYFIYKEGAYV